MDLARHTVDTESIQKRGPSDWNQSGGKPGKLTHLRWHEVNQTDQ